MVTTRDPDTLVIGISSRALFDMNESHALFERSGFHLTRIAPLPSGMCLLEGSPR